MEDVSSLDSENLNKVCFTKILTSFAIKYARSPKTALSIKPESPKYVSFFLLFYLSF